MEQQERVRRIIAALKDAYPDPFCALHYRKDYELMIAVRLSAQCTDERVNKITPALFTRFPTLDAFADADISEVEEYVRSCGFYKHKARDIVLACQALREKFGGRVPGTMEELLSLPGVGRKTANLLLGDIYKVPGSVVCDTHCIRITNLLGLAEGKDPERWRRSCARFCRRRNLLTSVTGWCCTEEPCASRAGRSARSVVSRPTARAFRVNKHDGT